MPLARLYQYLVGHYKSCLENSKLMSIRLSIRASLTLLLWSHLAPIARAVPVANNEAIRTLEGAPNAEIVEEVPEEILRTEIITGARSPLTGEPVSADEYARLQDQLEAPAGGNLASEDIRYIVFLLQVRRAIKPIIPFIP